MHNGNLFTFNGKIFETNFTIELPPKGLHNFLNLADATCLSFCLGKNKTTIRS